MRKRNHEHGNINESAVGIVTTNEAKFESYLYLCELIGIGAVIERISALRPAEEPVTRDPMVVGIGKLASGATLLEEDGVLDQLAEEGKLPDRLLWMDVLAGAVLKRIGVRDASMSEKESVMKKPEKGLTALEAFTQFFALCLEQMDFNKMQARLKREAEEEFDYLTLAYYLIQAEAPVDAGKRKVDIKCARVEWEKIEFTFSRALVEFLADPDKIKSLANNGYELEKLLGNDTIVGMYLDYLIPTIVDIAAMSNSDEMTMWINYKPAGLNNYQVDKEEDLSLKDVQMRIGKGKEEKVYTMRLTNFIYHAVKNSNLKLLEKIYLNPKDKKSCSTE